MNSKIGSPSPLEMSETKYCRIQCFTKDSLFVFIHANEWDNKEKQSMKETSRYYSPTMFTLSRGHWLLVQLHNKRPNDVQLLIKKPVTTKILQLSRWSLYIARVRVSSDVCFEKTPSTRPAIILISSIIDCNTLKSTMKFSTTVLALLATSATTTAFAPVRKSISRASWK